MVIKEIHRRKREVYMADVETLENANQKNMVDFKIRK